MSLIEFNRRLKEQTPDGWQAVSFGNAVERSQYGLSIATSEDGNAPILGMSSLGNGKIAYDGLSRVALSDKDYEKFRLRAGDILVNRTNSAELVGKTALVEEDQEVVFASYLVRFIVDSRKAIPAYLNYYLNQDSSQRRLSALATQGVSQANINPEALKKLFFLHLPPLPEQQKIADILSIWDRGIEMLEKLIATKQRRKRALMQRLLTGAVRFPQFAGQEWREVKLKDFGEIVAGGTPDTTKPEYWDGDIHWVTPSEITVLKSRFLNATERRITAIGLKNSAAKLLPIGSLVVCTRATVGDCAVTLAPICTNQGFKSIIPGKGYNSDFLYYLISFNKHEFIRLACGSTFLEISKKDFCKITFVVPSLDEQQAIASVLNDANTEIEELEKILSWLANQKRGLMQQLLTGRIRVQAAEPHQKQRVKG